MTTKTTKDRAKSKPSGADLKKTAQPSPVREYSFRLVIAIVERGSADDIVEILLKEFGIKFHIVCQGDGTADSAILQLLNLDKSAKDVVICVVETAKCHDVIQGIREGYREGGIAFSIKLNSIGGMRSLQLLKDNSVEVKDKNSRDIKE